MVRKQLGPDYDVDTHFTPTYNPWDQRLCLVPNGDLFEAINVGQGHGRHRHDRHVHRDGHRAGERRGAGGRHHRHRHRPAAGDARRGADRRRRRAGRLLRDLHLQGLHVLRRAQPGLVVRLHQRLVDAARRPHLPRTCAACSTTCATPAPTHVHADAAGQSDAGMPARPWIEDFSSGYMQRDMDQLPKQGDREPWINPQSYTERPQAVPQGAARRRRDASSPRPKVPAGV